jgi:hypothetical protein
MNRKDPPPPDSRLPPLGNHRGVNVGLIDRPMPAAKPAAPTPPPPSSTKK